MAHKVNKKPGFDTGRKGLDLFDESIHLLRQTPSSLLVYYTGTVPFVVGFLFFWADMCHGALAKERLASTAFITAILYAWMKTWHAVYTAVLFDFITGERSKWTPGRFIRTGMLQTALQPPALFLLPLAVLAVVPTAWVYAFFNTLTVTGNRPDSTLISTIANSGRFTVAEPRKNHLLVICLSFAGLLLLTNVVITMAWMPYLLRSFVGLETVFSRSGMHIFSTTFFAVALALVFIVLDPLVKALYTLRTFYLEAYSAGTDLKVELKDCMQHDPDRFKRSPHLNNAGLYFLILLFLFLPKACVAYAEPPPDYPKYEIFDKTADNVLKKVEYRWRMPRDTGQEAKDEKDIFELFVEACLETILNAAEKVFTLTDRILDWFDNLIPEREISYDQQGRRNFDWIFGLYLLFYLALAAVAAMAIIACIRIWKKRVRTKNAEVNVSVEQVTDPPPDLEDEFVTADTRPVSEWLTLGDKLLREGHFRQALRAYYLASLADLADQDFVIIRKSKSNLEYCREVERHAHAVPEIASRFKNNVSVFDKVWYGRYQVTKSLINAFRENCDRIRANAYGH